jgi:AcrR family transcriptional regulator
VRADAERNRRAILNAVEELLRHHHPQRISMEQVAVAAGVGKGTVFHRFGNRDGLMIALIRERARDLDSLMADAEGAPRDRLLTFVSAVVALVARNKGLLAALGPGVTAPAAEGDRGDHPIYRSWHAHLTGLLAELRPDVDAEMTAHVLLAALHSEPILRILDDGTRLDRTLRALLTALTAEPP